MGKVGTTEPLLKAVTLHTEHHSDGMLLVTHFFSILVKMVVYIIVQYFKSIITVKSRDKNFHTHLLISPIEELRGIPYPKEGIE